MRLTRQLVEDAQLMDLRIHDHVIIGNGFTWLNRLRAEGSCAELVEGRLRAPS